MQGSGWQMLFSKLNDKDRVVNVDLSTLDKGNYIVLSKQLRAINLTREPKRQIIALDPDTLYFDFSSRRVKRVPVKLVKVLNYRQQYAQAEDIVIKPDYVTVSGPAEVLSGITSWKTDTLKGNDVSEPVSAQLKLQPVKEGNITVYPKNVQVTVPVDEFTEKVLQVPVKLINNKHYYNVKLYPQKVKITVVTSLSDYPDMDESFFEATADIDLWEKHGLSVLPVKLTRLPPYCRIVKIEPANVDFIIKK